MLAIIQSGYRHYLYQTFCNVIQLAIKKINILNDHDHDHDDGHGYDHDDHDHGHGHGDVHGDGVHASDYRVRFRQHFINDVSDGVSDHALRDLL